MKFLLCIVGMLGIFLSYHAFATSCRHSTCKEYLIRHELAFKGKALKSGATTPEMIEEFNRKKGAEFRGAMPDTYTDFEVTALYKGVAGKVARIYYSAHRRGPIAGDFDVKAYPDGQETTLYATRVAGFYITYRGLCSGCSGVEELEIIKSQYDAIDGLIKRYPKTQEFYAKKIALYEEYKDYEAAAATYEQAFAIVPGAKDDPELKARYGRALQLAGRPEDAIKVLDSVKDAPGASTDIQMSLLRLGRSAELSGQKLALAGQDLSNITFQDADLSGSDFSGAKLNNVKLINVNLENSSFVKAQMAVEISGSKLGGAKFDEAKIRGKLFDSNFDKASFVKTEMDLREANRNSFKGTDFSSGKVYIAECTMQPKDWEGNDFSGASFKGATFGGLHKSNISGADLTGMIFYTHRCVSQNQGIDLSGKNFDNTKFDLGNYEGSTFKGASLRNTSFTGDDLTEVNFSGADLTGADFTTSTYSGPVKLHGADFTGAKIDGVKWAGALFDCKTKFPAGFRPEEHQMDTKDRSCESASTKNPGVVDYDKERLNKGYMTVCNGDFHADCIYGFLASYYVKQQNWSYGQDLVRLAESFLDAGYPNLAKVMVLKSIGGIALSRRSLDPDIYDKWLTLMERIEDAEHGRPSRKQPDRKILQEHSLFPEKLADSARRSAEGGDFDAALAYAEKMGGPEFNSKMLGWPADGSIDARADDPQAPLEYVPALTSIALERKRHGQGVDSIRADLEEAAKHFPKNAKDGSAATQLAALTVLTGGDPVFPQQGFSYRSPPDMVAAAYAEAGKIDKAWEIYAQMGKGGEAGTGLGVLSAIADYYTARSDNPGRKKLIEELKSYAAERWPQRVEQLFAGHEVVLLARFFDIIGKLNAPEILEGILSRTEAYTNEAVKAHARLYAATAFAQMGKTAEAFDLFEKCRKTFSEAPPPPEGRRMPQYIIMLSPGGASTMKTENVFVKDDEIGNFIFTVATSGASAADKQKALKAGQDLLSAGKAGSPLFRAQLAIANAAVLKDKDSGQKMKDAEYGVRPSVFAELLHKAGFHEAEKQLLFVAWASSDVPPAMGIERLGARGYAGMREGLLKIAAMLARDGHFEEAERAARTIVNAAAVQRVGGTSYITYFARQKLLYDIAMNALEQQKTDIALGFAKAKINYQPYQAGVYFALAKAAFDAKGNAEALRLYNMGRDMAPSFGDAMGAPLVDPDGLALEALVDRADVETKLGLTQNYNQTVSFARLAASLAENDIQRGKTSSVADRIAQLANSAGGAPKQSTEEFIKTLNIRDDLNSTSVVADMARKYLKSGDKERARAVAMYGFRRIDGYPQASGKAHVLLPYASIIARTEPRMSEEAQGKLAAILRQVHANTPGGKVDPAAANVDYVAEGQVAYAEMKRRQALVEETSGQNEAVAGQGAKVVHSAKEIEEQMQKWLEGAIKKYNAGHPNAPESIASYPGNKMMNEKSASYPDWYLKKRPYWLDNARIGSYVPVHMYGAGGGGYFIVPADVPRPPGPRKEATYFFLSDFTCEGNFPPFCKY